MTRGERGRRLAAVMERQLQTVGDNLARRRMAEVLAHDWEAPDETLQALSGEDDLAELGANPTGLIRRIAGAWTTPLSQIRCAQVRVLLTQGFGLAWLAAPVSAFVWRYPRAQSDLYPGDMTINALHLAEELMRAAPVETRRMLRGDFGWIEDEIEEYGDESGLFGEALEGLARGRRMIAQ